MCIPGIAAERRLVDALSMLKASLSIFHMHASASSCQRCRVHLVEPIGIQVALPAPEISSEAQERKLRNRRRRFGGVSC